MMEFQLDTPLVRDHNTVSVSVSGGILLMNIKSGCYFTLVGTGPRIWELLEQPSRPDAIVEAILAEFEVDAVTGREETLAYIRKLMEAGLVLPASVE